MIDKPLVSVVIPCYNLGLYLLDAINSVKNQSYKNCEIILVNDGSTDQYTIDLVRDIKKNDKDVCTIIQKNKGLSEARNVGIREAKGKYIVCLDSDDVLDEKYIEKTVKVIDSDKKIGFVTTWLKEFGNRNGVWHTEPYNVGKLLSENLVHVSSMFRKEAWKEVGGYKKEMIGGYEDWEFWISLVEKGYIWKVIDEYLFNYRVREGSMITTALKKHNELYGRIVSFHTKLYSKYATDVAINSSAKINLLEIDAIDLRNEIYNLRDRCQQQEDEMSKYNKDRFIIFYRSIKDKIKK